MAKFITSEQHRWNADSSSTETDLHLCYGIQLYKAILGIAEIQNITAVIDSDELVASLVVARKAARNLVWYTGRNAGKALKGKER